MNQAVLHSYNIFPEQMRELDQWVVWKLEKRNLTDQKPTKVPYISPTQRAKAGASGKWLSYVKASAIADEHNFTGVGFEFTKEDGLLFIDLDNILDEKGDINYAWAREVVLNNPDIFWEVSQSGTGLHGIGLGSLPKEIMNKSPYDADGKLCSAKDKVAEMELYDHSRFVALTGKVHGHFNSMGEVNTDVLLAYGKPRNDDGAATTLVEGDRTSVLTGDEVIAKIKDKDKWPEEYGADDDRSSVDLGLFNQVAFWCNGDRSVADEVLAKSPLNREKWARDDYMDMTWNKAMAGRTDFYTGSKKEEFDKDGVNQAVVRKMKKEIMKVRGGFEMLNPEGKWIFTSEKDYFAVASYCYDKFFDNSLIEDAEVKLDKLNLLKLDLHNARRGTDSEAKQAADQQAIFDNEAAIETAEYELSVLKGRKAKTVRNILTHIKTYNQYTLARFRVDPFAKENTVKLTGHRLTVITNDLFYGVDITEPKFDVGTIWTDYKEHFPEIDELLRFIVALRFIKDRKRGHLHIKMVSDWGKGFFTDIFRDLGLLTEVTMEELEKAAAGDPSGLNPSDFVYSWILFIDEFKTVKREVKNLSSRLAITPKGKQKTEVDIYAKIYASAKDVQSLTGNGVEEQFANRFSSISTGTTKINDRELFISAGKEMYFEAVKWVVYTKLRRAAKRYIKMGRERADRKADRVVNDFHAKYGLKEGFKASVSDFIGQLLEYIEDCTKVIADPHASPLDRLIMSEFFMHKGVLCVKHKPTLNKVFEEFANIRLSKHERGKFLYRMTEFENLFSNKRFDTRIDGKKVRGYKLAP